MRITSLIGNIIWLILGGLITGAGYIIGGLLICVTIIGIPWGIQAIKLGIASLFPFGKEVVETERGGGCLGAVFNILWLVLFGWEIALAHAIFGLILTITIIGIPFGKQHFKLFKMALLPFSYQIRGND